MTTLLGRSGWLAAIAALTGLTGCIWPTGWQTPTPRVTPIAVAIPGEPVGLRRLPYRELDQRPLPMAALVCAGGDVMLGSNLDSASAGARRPGDHAGLASSPDSLLAPLAPLAADADVVLVNVEGAIGSGPAPQKCRRGSRRCYAFRQNVDVAAALGRLGVLVVGNVANNHARDAGPVGFEQTVRHLREAGVSVTGSDSLPTLVPLAWGDTIAVLGFSTFSAGLDARDLEGVRRHVARAAARYGTVIVSVHMGAEGVTAQRTRDVVEQFAGEDRGNPVLFAHAAVDAGAALVVGHGPHVLRAMEWRGDALIAYSLGNLITHGTFSVAEPLNRGAFVCTLVDTRGRVIGADLRPTWQERAGRASPDSSARAAALVDSLSRLDFPGTGVRVDEGRLLRQQVRAQ